MAGERADSLVMLSIRTDAIVRPARMSDASALAAVHRDTWLQTYRGMIPHCELESMLKRRRAVWWRSAIAAGETILALELSGDLIGYATCGRARCRRLAGGEIYELYLLPTYQGLGLGEVLFEGCRGVLDESGYQGLIIWVLAENDPAQNFYWARGGRPIAKTHQRIGSTRLEKVAFVWS